MTKGLLSPSTSRPSLSEVKSPSEKWRDGLVKRNVKGCSVRVVWLAEGLKEVYVGQLLASVRMNDTEVHGLSI